MTLALFMMATCPNSSFARWIRACAWSSSVTSHSTASALLCCCLASRPGRRAAPLFALCDRDHGPLLCQSLRRRLPDAAGVACNDHDLTVELRYKMTITNRELAQRSVFFPSIGPFLSGSHFPEKAYTPSSGRGVISSTGAVNRR